LLRQVAKKPTITRRVREDEGISMGRSRGPDVGQSTVAAGDGGGVMPDSPTRPLACRQQAGPGPAATSGLLRLQRRSAVPDQAPSGAVKRHQAQSAG
jgi:hypothetical protein